MQFFRYLYHNVPDLASMWLSPDFLCALAATVFPFNIRPYSEMVRQRRGWRCGQAGASLLWWRADLCFPKLLTSFLFVTLSHISVTVCSICLPSEPELWPALFCPSLCSPCSPKLPDDIPSQASAIADLAHRIVAVSLGRTGLSPNGAAFFFVLKSRCLLEFIFNK